MRVFISESCSRKRLSVQEAGAEDPIEQIDQRTLTIGGSINAWVDLLFDWFGFDQTSKIIVHSQKQSS